MDQELYDRIQELQQAAYFRTGVAGGFSRIVNAPFLGGPIASAFERIGRFAEPTLELGRLGMHEIHEVLWGIDPAVDFVGDIANITAWTREGAINVRRMAGGRC